MKDEKSLNQPSLTLKRSWSAVIFGVITIVFPLLYEVFRDLGVRPVYFSLSYGGVDLSKIGLASLGLFVGFITIVFGVRREKTIFLLRKVSVGGCILVTLCWISYPLFNFYHYSTTPEVELVLPDGFQGKFAILIVRELERSRATWKKNIRYEIPKNGVLKLEEGFGLYSSRLKTLRFKSGRPILLSWERPSTSEAPHVKCFYALRTIYQDKEFDAGFLCELGDERFNWAPHPTEVSVDQWITSPTSISE